jgi:hypothetical protein
MQSKNPVTIVSCFYAIPENQKRSLHNYAIWLGYFLKYIQLPLVFYSDGDMYNVIKCILEESKNGGWKLIKKPLEELEYGDESWMNYWRSCVKGGMNGRVNSPHVFQIWANKLTFLEEVSTENPFDSEYFYWCDSCCWRDEAFTENYLSSWKLPLTPGFHCAWIGEYSQNLKPLDILLNGKNPTIAGGVIGGDKSMLSFIKLAFQYTYIIAKKYMLVDLNDQHILAASTIGVKGVHYWFCKEYKLPEGGDPWFLFQYLIR